MDNELKYQQCVESNIKEIESKLKRISDLLIETNKVLEELASMKVKVFFYTTKDQKYFKC